MIAMVLNGINKYLSLNVTTFLYDLIAFGAHWIVTTLDLTSVTI
jgi:hypothetical protein